MGWRFQQSTSDFAESKAIPSALRAVRANRGKKLHLRKKLQIVCANILDNDIVNIVDIPMILIRIEELWAHVEKKLRSNRSVGQNINKENEQ